MAKITLKGNPFETNGQLPEKGNPCPDFSFIKTDLTPVKISDLKGKNVILNIFPSIDTPVCATSVKTFNTHASQTPNTVVLCVSADLPFAHKRFCTSANLENVVNVSTYQAPEVINQLGVRITAGPLKDLCARAIVVVNPEGVVSHTELVTEIAEEPNYIAAFAAL